MAFAGAGAGILFGVSVGGIALFLRTNDERLDHIAEWAFVAFGIVSSVLILSASGHLDAIGPVATGRTVLGVAAVVAVGLGELGTAIRIVDYRRIASLVAAGFFAFLIWIGAVSLLLVASDRRTLPAGLGWLGLAAIAVGIVLAGLIVRRPGVMRGDSQPDGRLMVAYVIPAAAIVVWLTWLGLSLS